MVTFIVVVIASLLDPISLIGYAIAGLRIYNYWGAVAVGVAWQSLLILIAALFLAPALQESMPPLFYLAARLVGAFTATSLVYLVAGTIRKLMALPRICPECGIHNSPDNHWCECGYDLDKMLPPPSRKPIVHRPMAPSDDTKVVPDDVSQGGNGAAYRMKVIQNVRRQFAAEWTWRLFVSLQVLGILRLIYLNITDESWSVLPHDYHWGLRWDLLDPWYWTYHHQNWLAATCLIAPFLVAKAIDWVASAKDQ